MADKFGGRLGDIKKWVQSQRENYIADLISLVNIRSVRQDGGSFPFGEGCAKVLDHALNLAQEFETENNDYYCGSALYKGDTDREIALVCHLDVVPEGTGWDYEPYNAVQIDDLVVGRGTSDNKGPALAALYALKCLKSLGIRLNHSVRVLWGADEESQMSDMPHFLSTHRGNLPELFLVCDCPFPIHHGEKGILTADLVTSIQGSNIVDFSGGVATNSVPDFAYIVLSGVTPDAAKRALAGVPGVEEVAQDGGNVRISAKGKAGHAAFPQNGTESAIAKLAGIVANSGLLSGEGRRIVGFMADSFADYYGRGLNIMFEDDVSGKTTHVGGMVRVSDGRLIQNINVRYAIKTDREQMLRALKAVCEKSGFEVQNIYDRPPMYIPLEAMDGLPLKLAELSGELLDIPVEHVVLAGGTHARMLPNAIGYGPNLSPELEHKKVRTGSGHGPNESVCVSDMLSAAEVYAATLIYIDELVKSEY